MTLQPFESRLDTDAGTADGEQARNWAVSSAAPGAVLVCLSLLILGTATRAEAACDATWDCNNNVINDCIEGGAAISPTRDICGVTPTGYRLQSTFLDAAPVAREKNSKNRTGSTAGRWILMGQLLR